MDVTNAVRYWDEWDVIFQMLWSDPSDVDVMPKKLQQSSYRFGFGRLQGQRQHR